jgi:hypothetical protein
MNRRNREDEGPQATEPPDLRGGLAHARALGIEGTRQTQETNVACLNWTVSLPGALHILGKNTQR